MDEIKTSENLKNSLLWNEKENESSLSLHNKLYPIF